MKNPFFYIFFLIMFFRSSFCMEKLGPNDLYAWQILRTQDAQEANAKCMALNILFIFQQVPEKDKVMKVIYEACQSINTPNGLKNTIIKNAKPIFEKYISPALNNIKISIGESNGESKPNEIPFLQKSLGPDDMYAWQIFETKDPAEAKKIYHKLALQFHTDKYHGPDADKIINVIGEAYAALNQPKGLNTEVLNSKALFNTYIKPSLDKIKLYLNKAKIEATFKEIMNDIDNLKEEFFKLEYRSIFNDVIPIIDKLKEIIKVADGIKAKLNEIKYAFKEKAQIIEEELDDIQAKTQKRIKELEPAIQIRREVNEILYLTEVVKRNKSVIDEIKNMRSIYRQGAYVYSKLEMQHFEKNYRTRYSRNILDYRHFLADLVKSGVITSHGEITSMENIYKEILNSLTKIKQNDYFREDNPQVQSLLEEIEKMKETYTTKLSTVEIHALSNLTITLKNLANATNNLF